MASFSHNLQKTTKNLNSWEKNWSQTGVVTNVLNDLLQLDYSHLTLEGSVFTQSFRHKWRGKQEKTVFKKGDAGGLGVFIATNTNFYFTIYLHNLVNSIIVHLGVSKRELYLNWVCKKKL